MSKIALSPDVLGTGTVTVAAPNTNTDQTLTLPNITGTIVSSDSIGNVGIGTNSPTVNLDVAGSSTQTIRVATTDTTGTNVGRLLAVFTGGGAGGTACNAEVRAGNGYGYFAVTTNSPLLLATNDAERARITATGAVIVGATSTPWTGALFQTNTESTITIANNATITLTSARCGAALLNVYDINGGTGGLFFLNFSSAAVKVAGEGDATDTGTTFAVYKSAGSHVSTLRNRSGGSKTYAITMLAGSVIY